MSPTPPLSAAERAARDRQALQRLAASKARPAIKPPPRAGFAAARVLRPIAKSFGPSLADLSAHWPEIAGERLARLARPLRLAQGRDGAVLTLLARGPAAALVQAESSRIIERANLYCGAGIVARLVIRQGPLHDPAGTRPAVPSRPAPRGLAPSELAAIVQEAARARDPGLRGALENLGRAVLSRQAPPRTLS